MDNLHHVLRSVLAGEARRRLLGEAHHEAMARERGRADERFFFGVCDLRGRPRGHTGADQ